MKYYIATSLGNVENHHKVRDDLQTIGFELTYDWTVVGCAHETNEERLQEVALIDLGGVAECDFVVVLLPGGKGTHTELGYAIASGKKVFIHSEDPEVLQVGAKTSAFYYHPSVTRLHCALDEIAMYVRAKLAHPQEV